MPRVHGIMDSDQHRHRRNRNHNLLRGGSIFSLPTPFQQQPQQDDDNASPSRYSSCRHSSNSSCSNGDDNNDDATALDGENEKKTVAAAAATGHDDDGDDDDDGCNSSVDLLADEEDANNANDKFQQLHPHQDYQQNPSSSSQHCGQQQNHQRQQQQQRPSPTSALSPIVSPATKTLDRLSQFSSVEGGAELCMHLLADAAASVCASATSADIVETHHHHHHHGNNIAQLPNTAGSDNRQAGGGQVDRSEQERANNEKQDVDDTKSTAAANNTANDGNNNDDDDDDDIVNKRQLCLRKLKEYFMSTKNSSTYAKQQYRKQDRKKMSAPPSVPFCLRCNRPTSNTTTPTSSSSSSTAIATSKIVPPHHGLCPQHADFFNSGSYEILNLIVDGYLLVSCKACMYQFDNGGRMDKSLCHADGCLRRNKSVKKKDSGNSSGNNISRQNIDIRGGDDKDTSRDVPLPSLQPRVASKTIDQVVRRDGRNSVRIDPAADDVKQTPSPDHFDSSGRPLSDYERLRLRNIKRNNARLDKLGLLANPRPNNVNKKPRGGNNDSGSSCPGISMSPTDPRGTTLAEDSGKENGANDTAGRGKDPRDKRLLTDGLVTCKKCVTEKQTGVKTKKFHDLNCPLRMGSSKTKQMKRVTDDVDDELDQRRLLPYAISVAKARGSTDGKQCEHRDESEKGADPKTPQLLPRCQGESNKLMELEETTESSITRVSSILRGNDKSTNANSHQSTPSPLHHQGKKLVTNYRKYPPQIPSLTPLPSWINEFMTASIQTVPSPRGSKWLPCSNPWGKVGHDDDDFVIVSPFQSETMNEVLLSNNNQELPKRFVSNPLDAGSPYHTTHCSPARGGYSVLRLQRDRSCLRPWGFTVRLHEFGGACLLDSIEPLSPAEAAKDVSGWVDENISSGLKLHDMIICINGKCVGNMTMAELQIEFDVCGCEMLLTVSRFEIQETDNQVAETMQDLAMDWNNIGACASQKRKRVSFDDDRGSSKVPHLSEVEHYSPGIENDDIRDNDSDNELHEVEGDKGRNVPNPFHATIIKVPTAINGAQYVSQFVEDNAVRPREMFECSNGDEQPLEIHTRTVAYDQYCPHKGNPRFDNPKTSKQENGATAEHSGYTRKPSHSVTTRSLLQQMSISRKDKYDVSLIDETSYESTSQGAAHNRSTGDRADDDSLSCDTKEDSDDEDGGETLLETTKIGGVVSLSMAAKSGCRKCKRELRTGIKTAVAHDQNCPRKLKSKKTKGEDGAKAKHSLRKGKTRENNSQSNAKKSRQLKYATQQKNGVSHNIDERNKNGNKFTSKRSINNRTSIVDDGSLSCSSEKDDSVCEEDSDNEDGDENPWLGCVCGNTHPHPIKVFWIQCEGCQAWYNAAEECLGFDEDAAKELSNWYCWACEPPVAGMGL